MKIHGNKIEFSSGNVVEVCQGVVGLSLDGKDTYEGWDGGLNEGGGPLSQQDRAELADHMIASWQAWKATQDLANDDSECR
jgi:hypothetical protein